MKQMIAIRSNAFFAQNEQKETFSLEPALELVIIFTDGKDYDIKKGELVATSKLNEIRMIVSPELLSDMITDLQLHQKKLEATCQNADQINSLIKHISET
jgi:hypothetical protein